MLLLRKNFKSPCPSLPNTLHVEKTDVGGTTPKNSKLADKAGITWE